MRFKSRVARAVNGNAKQGWFKEQKQCIKYIAPKSAFLKKKGVKPSNKFDELNAIIPGLKYVFDSRKGFVFNVLWFLVIGVSGVACFYQISNRLQLFISNPVDSRVTVKQNESVKFPSLTVCSPEDRWASLINSQRYAASVLKIPLCDVTIFRLMRYANISFIWSLMNTQGLTNSSQILTKLDLEYHAHINTIRTKSTLTYFGTCTTYSIPNLVPFRGEDYKIRIPFITLNEYPCGLPFVSAMYFFHHDDEDITYKIITENSILLVQNYVNWGIEAKKFRVLHRSNAPCSSIARVSQCERLCVENILKTRITCRLPFMQFDDIPLCTNTSEAKNVYLKTRSIVADIVYSKNCSCPDRCEKILYTKSLMFTCHLYIPTLDYFFDSNVIVDIEEYYSYTIIPFICDVGGNLGLFLGLCIPAIIDILQNVIWYAFTKIAH